MSEAKSIFIYFYASSLDAAAWMLKFVRIIVLDDKNSNLFIWPSMSTRLEHAHCLERESVNAWKKADFDRFRDKDE
jgi:hypothetical protein